MVMKLKKYIKFALCCVLIMGLMSPIYATGASVSGDSFITKEEVDAAFSDFNRRLNTFEAGIGAKIDRQVTTYLDRNGIWSKKDITFKNGTTTDTIASGIESQITNFDTAGNYTLTETDWDWAPIEKNGLSCWTIRQTERGNRCLSQKAKNDAAWNTYTWYLNFDVYDKSGNFSRTGSTTVIRGATPQYIYTSTDYQFLFIGYSPLTYIVYFFVDKDEYVKFSEHWDVVGYQNWAGSRHTTEEKGNVPTYSFSGCGVY